jgi:hypothetical protein
MQKFSIAQVRWMRSVARSLGCPAGSQLFSRLDDDLDLTDNEAVAQAARRRAADRGCVCEPDLLIVYDPRRGAMVCRAAHADLCPLGEEARR